MEVSLQKPSKNPSISIFTSSQTLHTLPECLRVLFTGIYVVTGFKTHIKDYITVAKQFANRLTARGYDPQIINNLFLQAQRNWMILLPLQKRIVAMMIPFTFIGHGIHETSANESYVLY